MATFSIDGISSGLQTANIVEQLMALERRPMQKLQTQIAKEKKKLSAVQSIESLVKSFQTQIAKLADRKAINVKTAGTDTPSTSPAVLSVTAGADAINGSFKVTVGQLATATKVVSAGAIGAAVDKLVALEDAGFRLTPILTKNGDPATFSINGQVIQVDDTITLDGADPANSLIGKINAAGAGVTASLVADAEGRPENRVQIVSDAGQSLQLGSIGDTSNVLRLLNLADATVQGYSAASVVGSGPVAGGSINTTLTINGVNTIINTNSDAATNLTNIVNAINGNSANTVTAYDNGDGRIRLEQKTLGAAHTIQVSAAHADTGLAVGTTDNGRDIAVSTLSLSATQVGEKLTNARLQTSISGLVGGAGQFTINGVEIDYKETETVSTILNRINASNTGVTAYYDSVQDRVRLTASQTGGRAVTLQDDTGNFLQAVGLDSSATVTLGQNASFTIDSVNGGQPLTSSTNTVSGLVPGVTLELKSLSSSPVTVTVGQDTAASVKQINSFVSAFNALLDGIEAQTKYDAENKKASTLTGDTSVISIERMVRTLTSGAALGVTGDYQSLADLGITTGSVGSTVGTATRLRLDESKLTEALKNNPQAVESVFAAFQATTGTPSGSGNNLAGITGTPLNQHVDGTYHVKVLDAGTGEAEAWFIDSNGRELFRNTGTLTANQDNTTLIPGLKLAVGATLTAGEDTFSMEVDSRGVMVRLKDYVSGLLDAEGFFANREESSESITERLNRRIEEMELRLEKKEANLTRRFTALEVSMARMKQQSDALVAQLAQLG